MTVDTVLSRATGSLIHSSRHVYRILLMLLTRSGYVDSSLVPDFVMPICLLDDSSLSRPSSSCTQSSTRRFTSCSLTRLDAISVLYFYEPYASLYLYLLSEYI